MKSSPLFLKVVVLTGFGLSIVALVAYRSGRLDGLLYGQAYTSNTVSMDGIQPFPVDTPPPEDPEFMYSSKSGFVVRTLPTADSTKKDSSIYLKEVIGSSKSLIIDDGRPPQPVTTDTQKAVRVESFYIDPMYSSKSGRIIEPQKVKRKPNKKSK